MEDLRVYPTRSSQSALDRAVSLRSGQAELLHVDVDVEPANYNRGYYNIDIRSFFRITADAFTGNGRPTQVEGLAVFDKRVTLFGSEGNAKIFTSQDRPSKHGLGQSNLPEAVVEAVDPLVLSMRVADRCDCRPGHGHGPKPDQRPDQSPDFCPPKGLIYPQDFDRRPNCDREEELSDVPGFISDVFDNDLVFGGDRRWFVTLGLFSIVRLERDSQLLIPVYDYCMPTRECSAEDDANEDDPCEAFRQIRFPVGEFFPPNTLPGMEDDSDNGCGCGRTRERDCNGD